MADDSFFIGFSKFDVMFGRKTPLQIQSFYRDLVAPGIDFQQANITAIDPAARRVTTDAGTLDADILGADLDLAATSGLLEGGHDFYSLEGATKLAAVGERLGREHSFPIGGVQVARAKEPLSAGTRRPSVSATFVTATRGLVR